MDEMRSEIRAAFEREQSAHAPVPGLRRQVVDTVSVRQRRAPNFQWVAVAAAVILGVLVVIGLMSTRFHPRAIAPAATPNAAPLADYGPPPAGIALLYVHDPIHASWLVGYDWAGQPRATVKLGLAIDAGQYVGMSPDGQGFLVSPAAKGGSGVFLDRLGAPIPALGGTGGYFGGVWADDNRHYCTVTLDQQTFAWTLVTQGPGEAPRQVAVIARDTGIGQTGIGVAACSYQHDQAILVRTVIAWPSEMWVMQLSTGKILSHNAIADKPSSLIASRDTLFTAVNSTMSTSGQAGSSASTLVHRESDGSVVATLDPAMGVLAFSHDNSLLLVTTSPSIQGQPAHLAIVDVKSLQVIWRYDGPESLGGFLVEQPDIQDRIVGPGFAIALKVVPPQATPCVSTQTIGCHTPVPDPQSDILLVEANGTVIHLAGHHVTAW